MGGAIDAPRCRFSQSPTPVSTQGAQRCPVSVAQVLLDLQGRSREGLLKVNSHRRPTRRILMQPHETKHDGDEEMVRSSRSSSCSQLYGLSVSCPPDEVVVATTRNRWDAFPQSRNQFVCLSAPARSLRLHRQSQSQKTFSMCMMAGRARCSSPWQLAGSDGVKRRMPAIASVPLGISVERPDEQMWLTNRQPLLIV